jgi:Transmembrane secretion effector
MMSAVIYGVDIEFGSILPIHSPRRCSRRHDRPREASKNHAHLVSSISRRPGHSRLDASPQWLSHTALYISLIGAAFAFNAPAFSSLLTDIVSDEELPSASVLSGLQLDIAGMIGPALGGALIPLIGTNTIFAANGACFLLINLALMQWRQPKGQPHSAMEDFFQSFATAICYVRYAPGMQVILARQVLFSLLVVAIPALLPVIGLKELHINAAELGLLYTSMGVGSVITAAFFLPWGRARHSPNTFTRLATYLLALVILLMAFLRQTQLLLVVAAFAGVAWTCTANELWVAGRRAMPGWARGRMIHLRNGAYSWQLFADPARPNHFHVEIMMPSWSQYLLHCERITKAEKEVIDRAISLHIGKDPPQTRMYIRVNKTFTCTASLTKSRVDPADRFPHSENEV